MKKKLVLRNMYYHQAKAWKKNITYIQPPKKATFCRHQKRQSLYNYTKKKENTAVHYFSRCLKKFIVYKQQQKKLHTNLPCSCSVYYILLSHCYKISTTLQKNEILKKKLVRKKITLL